MRSPRAAHLEFLDQNDLLGNLMRNKYADKVAIVITNGIEALGLLPYFATMKRDNYGLWMRAQGKNLIIRIFPDIQTAREWTHNFPADKDIKWQLWFKRLKIDERQ
jgi:hypothetical protein